MLIPSIPFIVPRLRDRAALLYFKIDDKPISITIHDKVIEYRLRGRCGAARIRGDVRNKRFGNRND